VQKWGDALVRQFCDWAEVPIWIRLTYIWFPAPQNTWGLAWIPSIWSGLPYTHKETRGCHSCSSTTRPSHWDKYPFNQWKLVSWCSSNSHNWRLSRLHWLWFCWGSGDLGNTEQERLQIIQIVWIVSCGQPISSQVGNHLGIDSSTQRQCRGLSYAPQAAEPACNVGMRFLSLWILFHISFYLINYIPCLLCITPSCIVFIILLIGFSSRSLLFFFWICIFLC
jgi:hypothetical protein